MRRREDPWRAGIERQQSQSPDWRGGQCDPRGGSGGSEQGGYRLNPLIGGEGNATMSRRAEGYKGAEGSQSPDWRGGQCDAEGRHPVIRLERDVSIP